MQTFLKGLPLLDTIYNSKDLLEVTKLSNIDFYINLAYFLVIFTISNKLVDYGLKNIFGIDTENEKQKKQSPLTKASLSIIACVITDGLLKPTKFQESNLMKLINDYSLGNIDAKSLIAIGLLVISIILILKQLRELIIMSVVMILLVLCQQSLGRIAFIAVGYNSFSFCSKIHFMETQLFK